MESRNDGVVERSNGGLAENIAPLPTLHDSFAPVLRKKRAGLLRLNGDEVAYAFTQALRRVMRPT
jgi:hypothetical protein